MLALIRSCGKASMVTWVLQRPIKLQQGVRHDETGYHVASPPAGHSQPSLALLPHCCGSPAGQGRPGLQLQSQATCKLNALQG